MRTLGVTLLGLGLVVLVAGQAAAQGPPRGFGARMGTYSGLLVNESVQKELKLDDKQVKKAEELDEKTNAEMREKFEGLQDLEGQERFNKMREIGRELNASALKTAAEFLKPDQVTRLKQISSQVRGAQAFSDPDVAQKLNITDAQKKDIQQIEQAAREKMPSRDDFQNDREAAMKKMQEVRKDTLAQIVAKLNDEQQKTWKDLLGAPFDIKYEQN
jgi:hypothetical protein